MHKTLILGALMAAALAAPALADDLPTPLPDPAPAVQSSSADEQALDEQLRRLQADSDRMNRRVSPPASMAPAAHSAAYNLGYFVGRWGVFALLAWGIGSWLTSGRRRRAA